LKTFPLRPKAFAVGFGINFTAPVGKGVFTSVKGKGSKSFPASFITFLPALDCINSRAFRPRPFMVLSPRLSLCIFLA